MGRPEERRQLRRPRLIWEDNIKMNLQEVDWGMDWIDLDEDTDRWLSVMNVTMNFGCHKMRGIS
jgi:hypothetical protein